MGRGAPILRRNPGRLFNLNNIHGIYARKDVPTAISKRVIEWLMTMEGATTLLQAARHYQRGMWKLEPGDVERLRLPAGLLE